MSFFSWSSQHFLVWPHNGTLRSHDRHNQFFADAEDISIQMQERAKNKCFKPWKPFIYDPEDKYLGWHVKLSFDWLESCKILMEDLAFSNQFTKEITGEFLSDCLFLFEFLKFQQFYLVKLRVSTLT